MKFRSQIQEWYTKLERSSPLSPHLLRQNSSDSGQQEPAVSIPILSPISSPQSEAAASPSRVSRGGTPPQEASTPDSDGFPPTPKMSATPSTCDVLGHKKKKRGGKETSSAAVCLTPEFPILTPAGLRASKRKSPLPLDRSSPSTPNLDSTPTTTIQLSPSHFILDDVLDGGDNDACSPAAAAVVGTQNKSSNDSSEVEEKLMSSLYAFNFEKKKKSEKVHSKSGDQESKQNKVRKAFDIQQFPAIFRSGNGSVELEQVYRKVEELSVLDALWSLSTYNAQNFFCLQVYGSVWRDEGTLEYSRTNRGLPGGRRRAQRSGAPGVRHARAACGLPRAGRGALRRGVAGRRGDERGLLRRPLPHARRESPGPANTRKAP